MRLLDRYLLRELLIPFSYCLIGFLIFWITADIFSQLPEFQKLRLKLPEVLEYYVVKMPEMMVTVLPIAFLLALLYALTNHARHHELTAIRAAGVSLARIAVPYLGIGVLLSLAVFAVSERWAPQSTEAAEEILYQHQANKADATHRDWEMKLGFQNHKDRRSWFIEAYNTETAEMIRPHIVWARPDHTRMEIMAERGYYANQAWTFTNVNVLEYSTEPGAIPSSSQTPTISMPVFTETPAQIRSEIKINKLSSFKSVRKVQLSIREILEYERLHPGDETKSAILDTKLHGRLAAPWTCLVVVLIALPFGAQTGRRNVAVGVASSIVICFVYFILQQFALALGTGGYVTPWIAAWTPNAFFAVIGLVLTWRAR